MKTDKLSNCCKARTIVDSADEGASCCYVCSECKRPCDLYWGLPLEQQVTSLEMSKKLKELGVPQNSLFCWFELKKDKWECWELIHLMQHWECCHMRDEKPVNKISAFTVAELGELLPRGTWLNVFFHSLEVQVQDKSSKKIFTDESEANARAKMLIHLIENNLLKL